MAIGASLMFNIKLPMNFNSPYKALDIQDFWRRWHMTLSRFLRDYIYIPLGGNRLGEFRTYVNLFTTFLLGGLWHGAGWTFIFWGALHGIALIIHRAWKSLGFTMNKYLAWFITFNFINLTWIFFRAKHWEDALKVINGMFGLNGVFYIETPYFDKDYVWQIALVLVGCVMLKNSIELISPNNFSYKRLLFGVCILTVGLLKLQEITEFLYFNF